MLGKNKERCADINLNYFSGRIKREEPGLAIKEDAGCEKNNE